MTTISPDEYDLLMSISGYELNLQATNIGNKYGLSASQVIGMLPNQATNQQHNHQKKSPLQPINTNISAQSNHRFEYDPSPDASHRRQQVSQAINCPGCGAALGIPSIRPIKVTCPQCFQENTFLE
tara:strand:+ start:138 stop:515 length:378 start_codon:yes stop_codon:yes gene_type:complete